MTYDDDDDDDDDDDNDLQPLVVQKFDSTLYNVLVQRYV